MQERVLAEVGAIPGVRRAAMSLLVPLSERSWELRAYPEGGTLRDNAEHTLFNMVTAEYFATMGVPIVQGRAFTADDRTETSPVVIVDEVMAARLWPGQSALGKRISLEEPLGGPDSTATLFREVVGVTHNLRHYAVSEASRPQAYLPSTQARGRSGAGLSVLIQTSGDPSALTRSLRDAIGRVDPGIALSDVRPLQTYVEDNLGNSRLLGVMLTVFSVVALGLAAIGIFGMIAYSVSRRTREWGVRMALGAEPQELIRGIVWRGLALSAVGVAVGLIGAVLLSHFLGALLYGVRAVDPLTYVVLALTLLAVTAVASWLPSRKVARIDAARVLGAE
jgi:predicted permease